MLQMYMEKQTNLATAKTLILMGGYLDYKYFDKSGD
jgi:hypothetical protein